MPAAPTLPHLAQRWMDICIHDMSSVSHCAQHPTRCGWLCHVLPKQESLVPHRTPTAPPQHHLPRQRGGRAARCALRIVSHSVTQSLSHSVSHCTDESWLSCMLSPPLAAWARTTAAASTIPRCTTSRTGPKALAASRMTRCSCTISGWHLCTPWTALHSPSSAGQVSSYSCADHGWCGLHGSGCGTRIL